MFTIIIPTHNRHEYLKRSISYYSKFNIEVYIVDSSDNSFDTSELPSNFSYVHLPGALFHDKILHACKNIANERIALCPDDDFLLPSALYKAEGEMLADSNVSISLGNFIFFNSEQPERFYSKNPPHPNPKLLSEGDASSQINHFMANFTQVLWSLYRKDVLIKSFEFIKLAKYKNDNFIELTISCVAFSMGSLNFIPHITGVREVSPNEHWATRHRTISSRRDMQDIKTFTNGINSSSNEPFADRALANYLSRGTILNKIRLKIKKKMFLYQNPKGKVINTSGELAIVKSILLDSDTP